MAPAPAYFDDEYSYADRITLGVPNIDKAVEMSSVYEKTLTNLMEKATQVRTGLQASVEKRQSGLRALFSEVETSATRIISDDSRLGR